MSCMRLIYCIWARKCSKSNVVCFKAGNTKCRLFQHKNYPKITSGAWLREIGWGLFAKISSPIRINAIFTLSSSPLFLPLALLSEGMTIIG